jgi:hypothetical protein
MGGARFTPQDLAKIEQIVKANTDKKYEELIDLIHLEFPDRDRIAFPSMLRRFFKITKTINIHGSFTWDRYRQINKLGLNPTITPTTAQPQYTGPKGSINSNIDYWAMKARERNTEFKVDLGVIYTATDPTKAKDTLRILEEILTQKGLNYTTAADTTRLMITRTPNIIQTHKNTIGE